MFSKTVDGHPPGEGDPNYFAVTISPTSGTVIQQIHDELGENAGGYASCSADLGTRLWQVLDLLVLKVRHENGSEDVIPSSAYVVAGKTVTIVDLDVMLALVSSDRIVVNYQPRTLF